jgi:hypothetical protein
MNKPQAYAALYEKFQRWTYDRPPNKLQNMAPRINMLTTQMERIGKIQACEMYNVPTRSITEEEVNASHKPFHHAFQHNFTNHLPSNALPQSKYCQYLTAMLYTHRLNVFSEKAYIRFQPNYPKSTHKYFMNLLLHELVPQSFLHICSED